MKTSHKPGGTKGGFGRQWFIHSDSLVGNIVWCSVIYSCLTNSALPAATTSTLVIHQLTHLSYYSQHKYSSCSIWVYAV